MSHRSHQNRSSRLASGFTLEAHVVWMCVSFGGLTSSNLQSGVWISMIHMVPVTTINTASSTSINNVTVIQQSCNCIANTVLLVLLYFNYYSTININEFLSNFLTVAHIILKVTVMNHHFTTLLLFFYQLLSSLLLLFIVTRTTITLTL